MATYNIRHICGHEQQHSILGMAHQMQRKIADREADMCSACRASQSATTLPSPQNTSAQAERMAIERDFMQAEGRRDYPGQYFPLLQAAESRFDAWKRKYPREYAAEQIADLRARAALAGSSSHNALFYDADGLLTPTDQERRSADYAAERDELLAQASAIAAKFGL